MRKNSQLHLLIETNLLKSLKREAEENSTSLSEYCRKKLREGTRLEKIERMLKEILNKNEKENILQQIN